MGAAMTAKAACPPVITFEMGNKTPWIAGRPRREVIALVPHDPRGAGHHGRCRRQIGAAVPGARLVSPPHVAP